LEEEIESEKPGGEEEKGSGQKLRSLREMRLKRFHHLRYRRTIRKRRGTFSWWEGLGVHPQNPEVGRGGKLSSKVDHSNLWWMGRIIENEKSHGEAT